MAGAKGMSMPDWTCPCGRVVHGNLAFHSHLSKHLRYFDIYDRQPTLDHTLRMVKGLLDGR